MHNFKKSGKFVNAQPLVPLMAEPFFIMPVSESEIYHSFLLSSRNAN